MAGIAAFSAKQNGPLASFAAGRRMQRKNSSSNLKADPSRVLHALAALPALKYMPHEAHVELSKKFSKKTFVKGGLPVGVASFGWLYIFFLVRI